jgi:hypothetical protein
MLDAACDRKQIIFIFHQLYLYFYKDENESFEFTHKKISRRNSLHPHSLFTVKFKVISSFNLQIQHFFPYFSPFSSVFCVLILIFLYHKTKKRKLFSSHCQKNVESFSLYFSSHLRWNKNKEQKKNCVGVGCSLKVFDLCKKQ